MSSWILVGFISAEPQWELLLICFASSLANSGAPPVPSNFLSIESQHMLWSFPLPGMLPPLVMLSSKCAFCCQGNHTGPSTHEVEEQNQSAGELKGDGRTLHHTWPKPQLLLLATSYLFLPQALIMNSEEPGLGGNCLFRCEDGKTKSLDHCTPGVVFCGFFP